jgi:hypothetical protein
MSLLDDIKAEDRAHGTPCGVQRALEQLDKADRADLLKALADPLIPASNIARALLKRGVLHNKNAGDTITRHRRGDCRCDPR